MFETVSPAQYQSWLDGLENPLRVMLDALYMPDPSAAERIAFRQRDGAMVHPPSGHRYVIVDGDLRLNGVLNMWDQPGDLEDGNTVLVVNGDLHCRRLINTWGGVILVGGNLSVDEVFLGSYEDSYVGIGGDATVWFYHGIDIWLEVGGTVKLRHGDGYALPLGYTRPDDQAVYPAYGIEESYRRVGLAVDQPSWETSEAFLNLIWDDVNGDLR